MTQPNRTYLKWLLTAASVLALSACDQSATNAPQSGAAGVVSESAADTSETSETEQSEDARLSAFFQELFDRNVAQSPMFQAQLGMKTDDYGSWDDFSDAEAERQTEQTRGDLARLRNEFDYDSLSEQSKVSYRIFEYNQEQALRNWDWRHNQYVVTQMFSVASFLPTFLQNVHRVDTVGDAEAYISRVAGIEDIMQTVAGQLRDRESRGVVPPSLVYPRVLDSARNIISGAPFEDGAEDGAIYADIRGKIDALGADDAEKERLTNEATAALTGPFRAGYETLIAELERLQGVADNNHGVWALPNGEAYYANRIQSWTTVDSSADELHDLGLAEVARIRSEMTAIKDTVGFEGDLSAFFEFVRNDPNNYYANTDEGREEYLADARALIDEIYERTDAYFNVLPQAPLEVRRVEPWREASSSTAFYNRPAPDGSRPGIYYVNMKDMADVQKHIMNSLAYHEGAPGHHFQIAIAQELEGIPNFRKFGGFSVYSEGWALYSERLAYEMGLYEGLPMRDFGRLAEEMKRAVRLVVDTGMHAKQWSREDGIAYMTANTPMASGDIERQIERYIVLPGQALTYKVGMMKLLELRDEARNELGDAFDIREFHDVVLKNGAVPIPVLERLIESYIAEKKAS